MVQSNSPAEVNLSSAFNPSLHTLQHYVLGLSPDTLLAYQWMFDQVWGDAMAPRGGGVTVGSGVLSCALERL